MRGDVYGEKTPYDDATGDSKRKRLQLVRDRISSAVVDDFFVQSKFWQKQGVHPDALMELGQEELTRISGAQHGGEGKTKDIVGKVKNRNWESMLSWSKERHRFGFQNPSAEVGRGDVAGEKYTKPGVTELDYANMHPADRKELAKHRDTETSANIDTEQMRVDEVDPDNRAEALVEQEQGRPYKDQGPSSKSYQAESKDAFTTAENYESKRKGLKQVVPSILTAEGEYTRTGTAATETAIVGKDGAIGRQITGGSKKPARAVFQDTDRTSLLTAKGKPVFRGNVEGQLLSQGPQALGSSWSDLYDAGSKSQPSGASDLSNIDPDDLMESTPYSQDSTNKASLNQSDSQPLAGINPADAKNAELRQANAEQIAEDVKTFKSNPNSAEGTKARQQALGRLLTEQVQDASKSTLDYSQDVEPATAYRHEQVKRTGGTTSSASLLTELTHPGVKPEKVPPRLVKQQIEGGKVDLSSEQRVTTEAARRFAKAKSGVSGEAVVESIKGSRDPFATLTQGLQQQGRSWDAGQPRGSAVRVLPEKDKQSLITSPLSEESYNVKREAQLNRANPNRTVASSGPAKIKTALTSSGTIEMLVDGKWVAATPVKVPLTQQAPLMSLAVKTRLGEKKTVIDEKGISKTVRVANTDAKVDKILDEYFPKPAPSKPKPLQVSTTPVPPGPVADPAKQKFKHDLQRSLNISPQKVRIRSREQQKQVKATASWKTTLQQVRATALTSKTTGTVMSKAAQLKHRPMALPGIVGIASLGYTFGAAVTEAASQNPTLKPSNIAVTAGKQLLGPRAAQKVFGGGVPKPVTAAQRKYGQISAAVKPFTPQYRAGSATSADFAEAKKQKGGVTPYHSVLNWFKSFNKEDDESILSPRLGQRRRHR